MATDYAAKIELLEAAMGRGELTVESDGDRVTYRSITEMLAALTYFKSQQAAASSTARTRSASTLASFSLE